MKFRLFGPFCAVFLMAAPAFCIVIDNAQSPAANLDGTASWLGVGMLTMGGSICTGTLISDNVILTAAHCLFDQTNTRIGVANMSFTLTGLGEPAGANAISEAYLPQDFGFSAFNGVDTGNDIAVLKLANPLMGATTYAYNTGEIADELNPALTVQLVGYGRSGNGNGSIPGTAGNKRNATNIFDDYGTGSRAWTDGQGNVFTPPADTLLFDFDAVNMLTPGGWPSGAGNCNWSTLENADNNADSCAGGALEGDTAPGDSGGPGFQYDGVTHQWIITGVTSFGSDIPSRYGDIGVDTRVLSYDAFIQDAIDTPEPSAFLLCAVGFGIALSKRRKSA